MLDKEKYYSCAHPKTRENTYVDFKKRKRCAICQKAYSRATKYKTYIYLDHIAMYAYLKGLEPCQA